MSRLTAGARLERLLSIVPWVVANDGPTLSEISARFDYPEDRLLQDLTDVLFLVGTYPFTPDQLVEVVVEDDRVWIRYAEYFERPLRLTPDQALALVTAGSSLLAIPGADPEGPLARGLAKLAETLGIEPGTDIEVDLGDASPDILATIREAIADRRRLRIDYYAYNRDEVSTRTIDPFRVTSDAGQWYLLAHCHRAEGERLFRIDRIRSLHPLDDHFDPPADIGDVSVFEPRVSDPRVVLSLAPGAGWVPEAYPSESVERLPDGGTRVTLAISEQPWLARLLVQLGPDARLEDVEGDIPADLAARTAGRILARYGR